MLKHQMTVRELEGESQNRQLLYCCESLLLLRSGCGMENAAPEAGLYHDAGVGVGSSHQTRFSSRSWILT